MKRCIILIFTSCFSLLFFSLNAQPDVVFTSWITSGLSSSVDIANAGDGTDRLFIVERSGVIKIIENDAVNETPFMDISAQVGCCGERGLLGLVFHPNYSSNGYFYIYYTDNGGDTNVSRFEVDASNDDLGDPNSEVILLEIEQPFTNHNGGDLSFGPNDGYLYIATGDGGSGGDPDDRSQNGRCLLGKILRIDVDGGGDPATPSQSGGDCDFTSSSNYTIPNDNPFVNDPSTYNEVWSTGLRNPWRFSFDSSNGNMWIADVGQNAWEEVNVENSGAGGNNYGWRCYEGNHEYNTNDCNSTYIDADFEYGHSLGWSITGGYVYRGSDFPNMLGYYILADYGSNRVWSLFREGDGSITSDDLGTGTGASKISTFGVDENGELYAAGLNNSTIYKVEDNSPLPVELSSFSGFHEEGINILFWTTESEINTAHFDIEKSTDGINFTSIGKVEAIGDTNFQQRYQFNDQDFTPSFYLYYYRLKIIDNDGQFEYSKIINIAIDSHFNFTIYPNPNNGKFTVFISGDLESKSTLKIYNTKGAIILSEQLEITNSFQKLYDLSNYQKGIYLIQLSSEGFEETQKLILR